MFLILFIHNDWIYEKCLKTDKLVEIKGNPTGTYGTTDIEVIYVYEFVGGMGGEIVDLPVINTDNNIPITGVNDNYITETIFAISIVSLFATCILRKKYN